MPVKVNCIQMKRPRGWSYNECEDDVAEVPLSARHCTASLLLRLVAVELLVLLRLDGALHLVGCEGIAGGWVGGCRNHEFVFLRRRGRIVREERGSWESGPGARRGAECHNGSRRTEQRIDDEDRG